jgi:hypothetical protein
MSSRFTRGYRGALRRVRQAGQAATEMLIVTLAIGSALLVPWFDGESAAELLLSAVLGASQTFLSWLAVA